MKSKLKNETSDFEARPPKSPEGEPWDSARLAGCCDRASYSSPSGRMGGVVNVIKER
jgi:hypothetical protein